MKTVKSFILLLLLSVSCPLPYLKRSRKTRTFQASRGKTTSGLLTILCTARTKKLEVQKMKTSVRVIKHNSIEPDHDLKSTAAKSVETSTREIVSTVKSWIEEMQLRKRTQIHSFSALTVAASARK
jgi:hypothetical protein